MRDDGFVQSSAHKQTHAKRVNAYGVSLKFNLAARTSQSAFFNNARVVGDRHVAGAPRDDGILFLKFLYITLARTLRSLRLHAFTVYRGHSHSIVNEPFLLFNINNLLVGACGNTMKNTMFKICC